MNYYNEFDPHAAEWLRELIRAGLIPPGHVDDRSILDVRPSDLAGYTQCHFFAGIGGWPYALKLAGIPADRPLWTGSPPCQPFSSAGKRRGVDDERHLWPVFFDLISQCRPASVLGEQVEAAIGHGWLDHVFDDLENEGYACGAVCAPACGVGAPHIRQRLFFVAHGGGGSGLEGGNPRTVGDELKAVERGGEAGGMGHPGGERRQQVGRGAPGDEGQDGWEQDGRHLVAGADPVDWTTAIPVPCRDGRKRPVPIESVFLGVADGVPARVDLGRAERAFPLTTAEIQGRAQVLKGMGNAIVAPLAAEFIRAALL